MARHHRILVVADDHDQRSLFQLLLSRAGYAVVAVEDGAGALAQLEDSHFDLLLTDYLLPDILGDQLIAQARQEGTAGKVVLMSNHVDAGDIARACRADGCFHKVDCQQLLTMVGALLDHEGMTTPR